VCLIGIALGSSPQYPFVLAANRDEFHDRPTAAARWWLDETGILGGRDELAGGTWLGVNRKGRLAAVTNVHVPGTTKGPKSRGSLVSRFLASEGSAAGYAREIESTRGGYSPFNLLLYADDGVLLIDHSGQSATLGAGYHAVSNSDMSDLWPKAVRMREGLATAVKSADPAQTLFSLLREHSPTSSGADHRRDLFIRGANFGTRCSTVILVSADRYVEFIERRFDADANLIGENRFMLEVGA